ncbi:QRFP-like peptide receptor [Saccoglossus kowalevskii]|uniref:Neuropeptide FF receptor 2-like n=1 Tax=Saccoglossus kowalevskii TaxID=10224 RepID=A0ABM0GK61_SACKO|nr:PREDICTED: neuropeptide FF receptor 2-like [Saccoglossus kowalevskii]
MDCSALANLQQLVLLGILSESDIDPALIRLNCSNLTDTSLGDYSADEIIETFRQGLYTHGSPSTLALIVLYVVSFTLGCIGNILVIIAWFRNKHIRTIINCFLVNLAVCDLAVVLVCMPITLGNIVYQEWIYGEVLCKLTPCVQGMSVSSSVFILTAVSLNRFYAIHSPLKAKVLFTRNRVRILIVIIWIISLILMIPILIVNRLVTEVFFGVVPVTWCQEEWRSMRMKHAYNMCLFLVQFALPMLFMFAAYAMIVRALVFRSSELGKDANPDKQLKAQNRSRSKVVRLLMAVVLLFAVSWFPYHVATIWTDYHPVNEAIKMFPFVQWLGLCSSSLNPICYCFLSKTYRKTFKASLQCKWKRKNDAGVYRNWGTSYAFSLGATSVRPRRGKPSSHNELQGATYAQIVTNGNYMNDTSQIAEQSVRHESQTEVSLTKETEL